MTPLSPKMRFLQNKLESEAHAKFMSSTQFERASDLAMLQTRLNLPVAVSVAQDSSQQVAAANHYRMQGAEQFLLTLMTLGDPIPERPEPPNAGLNFEATKVKP